MPRCWACDFVRKVLSACGKLRTGGLRKRYDRWGNFLDDAHGYRGPRQAPIWFRGLLPFIIASPYLMDPTPGLSMCMGRDNGTQSYNLAAAFRLKESD